MKADIETVQLIVQASICLRNFLQLTFSTFYNPSRFLDTELSDGSVEVTGEELLKQMLVDWEMVKYLKMQDCKKTVKCCSQFWKVMLFLRKERWNGDENKSAERDAH